MTRYRGMQLGLCLIAGVIISAAIATLLAWVRDPLFTWGMGRTTAFYPYEPARAAQRGAAGVCWTFMEADRFGERRFFALGMDFRGVFSEPLAARPPIPRPIADFLDHRHLPASTDWARSNGTNTARAHGWPLPCLWHGETVDGVNARMTGWPWNDLSYGGIKVGMTAGHPHYISALPLWPGLAADSVMYAGACYVAFAAVGAIRRKRRLRKKLCVRCGYDRRAVTEGSPCPECGRTEHSRELPSESA